MSTYTVRAAVRIELGEAEYYGGKVSRPLYGMSSVDPETAAALEEGGAGIVYDAELAFSPDRSALVFLGYEGPGGGYPFRTLTVPVVHVAEIYTYDGEERVPLSLSDL